MPINTRSMTSSVCKTLPAKRTYDEMTSDEDSDSDFYPEEIRESMIEEIEELKEQLEKSKNAENGLIDALVDEREKTRDLENQLNEWIEKYAALEASQKESDKLMYYTYIALLVLFSVSLTISISTCYY